MSRLALASFLCLACVVSGCSGGQTGATLDGDRSFTLTLDLAQSSVQDVTVPLGVGQDVRVEVKNMVPDASQFVYDIRVEVEAAVIEALQWDPPQKEESPEVNSLAEECSPALAALRTAFSSVYTASTEREVRDRLLALQSAEDAVLIIGGCTPPVAIRHAIAQGDTRIGLGPYRVGPGQRLVVTVRRIPRAAGGTEATWRHIGATSARGRWVTSTGPAVVAELWDEPTYFAEPQPADSAGRVVYLLREEADRQHLIPSGAVFFTWLPAASAVDPSSVTGSGFVGLNTDGRFTLGGGATVAFNQNVLLHGGVALHSVETLLGRYRREDQTGTVEAEGNLSFDQLHDPQYRVNPFVSLTFRFGPSPAPPGLQASTE